MVNSHEVTDCCTPCLFEGMINTETNEELQTKTVADVQTDRMSGRWMNVKAVTRFDLSGV